jgi:hypothetical protein
MREWPRLVSERGGMKSNHNRDDGAHEEFFHAGCFQSWKTHDVQTTSRRFAEAPGLQTPGKIRLPPG